MMNLICALEDSMVNIMLQDAILYGELPTFVRILHANLCVQSFYILRINSLPYSTAIEQRISQITINTINSINKSNDYAVIKYKRSMHKHTHIQLTILFNFETLGYDATLRINRI